MPGTTETGNVAAEPGQGSVHVPTAMGGAKSKAKRPLNTHFMKRMMASMMERYSEEEIAAMKKQAACHAGGITKAEKVKLACMQTEMYAEDETDEIPGHTETCASHNGGECDCAAASASETMTEEEEEVTQSLSAQIREIEGAFQEWAKLPNLKPGQYPESAYWSREIFPDYVIAEGAEDRELYKIPFQRAFATDNFTFGSPVKVATRYVPITASEVADLCTDNHGWRLFVEHEFAEAPEWMPLLPKPGKYAHPKYGDIKLSKTRNASFADGVNNKIYQSSLPINTEHAPGNDGAYGWIEEARLNEDGSVDARVAWTDLGVDAIAKDRFRFISPEWADECDSPDGKKLKDVIRGAALTVRPFFKDKHLRPLVASERGWEVVDHMPASDSPQQYFFFTALQPSAPASQPGTLTLKEPPMADKKETVDNKEQKPDEGAAPAVKTAAEPTVSAKEFSELKARQDALEAENKQFREEAEANKAEVKKLSEVNAKLTDDAETMRFTEEVEGKSKDNKHAYVGEASEHVTHLKSLAKAFGEDSAEVKHYLKTQRQAATLVAQSLAFREIGVSGVDAETTAYGKLVALANEHRAKNSALTFEQSFAEVMNQPQHKELYQRYTEEGN